MEKKKTIVSLFNYFLGSIYGGTRVTINGDGFISGDTWISIPGANYTYIGSASYSQIIFTTPPELTYVNLNLNLYVYVRTSQSVCFIPSCYFSWSTSVTPYFVSVNPLLIRGRTNLNITGKNLLSGGRTTANAHVTINDNICNITHMTNGSITCTVMGVEAGEHSIVGSIDGLFLMDTDQD
jgi:hypothetical protein